MRGRHQAAIAGAVALLTFGCNALLDIDHVEFGDPPTTSSGGGEGGDGGEATTTASSGGSGGNGSGGGTGGVAPPSPEDCGNGLDDNGDDLVDCEDPLCACVEPAPTNWNGPVVIGVGSGAATCPADWPNEAERGFGGTLTAPPATCTGCSCGSVQGLACGRPTLRLYPQASCGGTPIDHTFTSTSCQPVPGGNALSARVTPPAVMGQCPPSGGNATVPPASFDETAVLCSGSFAGGDNCAVTSLCVPLPPPPFESKICVWRNSGQPCPAPYTELFASYFDDIVDSRDCSTCSCGAPQATCDGAAKIFSGLNCSSQIKTVSANNSCTSTTAVASADWDPNAPSGSGVCSASGGSPSGSAAGGGNLRVCCLP